MKLSRTLRLAALLFVCISSISRLGYAQSGNTFRPDIDINFVAPITDEVARGSFGMKEAHGVFVISFFHKPPTSDQVGVWPGDLIITINGQDIADIKDLGSKISNLKIGEDASVVVIRSGKELTVTQKVGQAAVLRTPSCEEIRNPGPPSQDPYNLTSIFGKSLNEMHSSDLNKVISVFAACGLPPNRPQT